MSTENKIIYDPFTKSVLTKKIVLHITEIGSNLKQNIERKIKSSIIGKCIPEGFVRTTEKYFKLLSYSCGIVNTEYIEYHVVFECFVCFPVEGQKIRNCVVKDITKGGIHAEYIDEDGSVPLTIFVARDHHNTNPYFNSIKIDEKIFIEVIGVQFEINDPCVYIIAKLLKETEEAMRIKPKKKLKILGGMEENENETENVDLYENENEEKEE